MVSNIFFLISFKYGCGNIVKLCRSLTSVGWQIHTMASSVIYDNHLKSFSITNSTYRVVIYGHSIALISVVLNTYGVFRIYQNIGYDDDDMDGESVIPKFSVITFMYLRTLSHIFVVFPMNAASSEFLSCHLINILADLFQKWQTLLIEEQYNMVRNAAMRISYKTLKCDVYCR